MHKCLKQWLYTKGKRLIELKVLGGGSKFIDGTNILPVDADKLSGNEWIEFFSLVGQLDGITLVLEPEDKDKREIFYESIRVVMEKTEKECRHILKITGKTNIPKGSA